jgi:hypothetical protein
MLAQTTPEAGGGSLGIVLTGWLVVGIVWLFFSAAAVVFLPLWQSRNSISHTIKIVFASMTGKGGRRGKAEVMQTGRLLK